MRRGKVIDVVGGGFAGLAQAYYLNKQGYHVRLFEKSYRLGGLLGSRREQGYLFEQAANAFLANQELEAVADDIGVKLVAKTNEARKRYILKGGKISRWPIGLSASLKLLPFLLSRVLPLPQYKPKSGESLKQWGIRVLGEETTLNFLEPAMQGIYASRSAELDAGLILQSLNRRPPKGKLRGSVSPQGGMQQWVDGMTHSLLRGGCDIFLNAQEYCYSPQHPVVFALGLKAMQEVYRAQELPLPQSLLDCESTSLSSLTLVYQKASLEPQGFGCLFPAAEDYSALGVLFNHSIFPGRVPQGRSETWILNDEKQRFSAMSPEVLKRHVLSDRSSLFGEAIEPDQWVAQRWPKRIPLYNNKLSRFLGDWQRGQKKGDPLLVGNYLGDLGLSKILLKAKANAVKVEGGWFG